MKTGTSAAVIALTGLLGLSGCGGDPNRPAVPSQGEIRVLLIDAPAAYDAVNIVVKEVSAHVAEADSGSGWTAVNDSTRTFDLLALANRASAVLCDAPLDAGHYTQIRLKLSSGSTVVVDGVEYPLEVPSGLQSGLKLNHPFDIEPDRLYDLTLDFDAARSIVHRGDDRYALSPVIRLAAAQISGTISGVISPASARGIVTAVGGADTVSAVADTTSGAFKLMALPAGSYDVRIDPLEPAYDDTTLTGVTVLARQDVDLGTVQVPVR
jgi:hypothetical protein